MNTEQIENSCICELVMMVQGWERRYYDLADLLISCCALPVYQMHMGKKAPKFKDLIRHRPKEDPYADLSHEELLALAKEE